MTRRRASVRRRVRAGRAFTLTELLVTLAIIAVLLTLSAGALSRLGNRDRLTATQQALRALLRRARNAARAHRSPATVELDLLRSRVGAQQRTPITQLRFEQVPPPSGLGAGAAGAAPFEVAGARGYLLTVEGAEAALGRYGGGLLFERADRDPGAAWAFVPDRPALSPAEGVYVSCWLYLGRLEERLVERAPQRPTRAQEERWARAGEAPRPAPPRLLAYDPLDPPIFWVVRKGRSYALGVTASYEVELALSGPGPDGVEVRYITRTRPHTLRPERWYRVAIAFDGREARVIVDGISRQHLPLPGYAVLPARLLRQPDAPLALSDPDPRQAFYGVIDELKLAAVLQARALALPADVVVAARGPRVAFDALGQLDPARHPTPFVLYLTDDDATFAPTGAGASAPAATRTRADEAPDGPVLDGRPGAFVGEEGFRTFVQDVLPRLDPARVRRLVVERTGLVTE